MVSVGRDTETKRSGPFGTRKIKNARTPKEGPNKMAKFRTCTNNGVIAICSEEVYQKIEARAELVRECGRRGLPRPSLPPVSPIFTFSDPNHSSHKLFHTGSTELARELLEGHKVERGWIWVPFSNGVEHTYVQSPESARWEWQFRTTLEEAMDAFGLIRN